MQNTDADVFQYVMFGVQPVFHNYVGYTVGSGPQVVRFRCLCIDLFILYGLTVTQRRKENPIVKRDVV